MNPLKHFFVHIIFLMAGLQVETAYGAGGEAAGKNSGVVYKDGSTKILTVQQFRNGDRF